MNKDGIEDLDEEIESAVDSLFVKKDADEGGGLAGRKGSFPGQAEPIPDISPEVMEESLEKDELQEIAPEVEPVKEEMAIAPEAEPIETEPLREEVVTAPEPEPMEQEVVTAPEPDPAREEIATATARTEPIEKPLKEEKLPKGVETLEVELLSLEWEFNSEIIKKIIAALGGLKAAYRDDDSLLKVINMMGKVSLYLLNDEKSITPEALRFLQDGKEVIKFLTMEKEEQAIFKNLVVAGINSHFQLLGLEGGERKDKPQDKIFQKLCSDLERDRMRLCEGENRLGRALHQFKGMKEEFIFDDGMMGLSDELEKIQGYLKTCFRGLGDISEQFQREVFGQKLYGVERVLLVEMQNRMFGIPSDSVIKSFTLSDDYTDKIAFQDSITLKGKRIPLIKLHEVFNLAMTGAKRPQGIVVVRERDQMIAVLVDRVLRNRSLFLKTTEQERKGLKYITATSNLESGKMVYILDIERLKGRAQT
jgi:chemotaxis protein histidine kinase CheA